MPATKKKPKKQPKKRGDTTPTYRPRVLERWNSYGLPHRLVVLEDGALEVQHRSFKGYWIRDSFAHDTNVTLLSCLPTA